MNRIHSTRVRGALVTLVALGVSSFSVAAAAGTPTVSQIPVSPATDTLDPSWMTQHDGAAFFTTHGTSGELLLWTTDGTSAGTTIVTTLAGGIAFSSDPPAVAAMVSIAGALLIVVHDSANARHTLWRSDGTSAGTKMVVVLPADPVHTSPTVVYWAAAPVGPGGTRAALLRRTVVTGNEWGALLTTDGTAAGTIDLATPVRNHDLVTFGEDAYFVGTDGNLRRTNGQTVTLGPTFADRDPAQIAIPAVACGGKLYLTYKRAGQNAWPLMRTDGASAPTEVARPEPVFPYNPVCVAGTDLFFAPTTTAAGNEPWVVDATGAHMVADISPGKDGSGPGGTAFGSRFFMSASVRDLSNVAHWGVYISNASNNGVTKLLDTGGPSFVVGQLGGQLYFQTDTLLPSRALHATDGSTVTPVPVGSVPFPLDPGVVVGSKIVSTIFGSGAPALWVLETGTGTIVVGADGGSTASDGGKGDAGTRKDSGKGDAGSSTGESDDDVGDDDGASPDAPSGGAGDASGGCDVAAATDPSASLSVLACFGLLFGVARRSRGRRGAQAKSTQP